ncbi:MAG: conjugal transfer protein TraB [Cellvibrionaceae bacterium]|nr:conjugal transfer protein TraB [Cellvibrionaceae bacterium]
MAEPKKGLLEQLKLDALWDTMSPLQQRGTVLVGGAAAIFLLMAVITANDGGPTQTASRETIKRSILTDSNTREIGIDALNAKVKLVESENTTLRDKLSSMRKELDEIRRRRGNDPDMSRELAHVQHQVKNLTDQAKIIGWDVEDIKEGYFQLDSMIETGNADATETETATPAKPTPVASATPASPANTATATSPADTAQTTRVPVRSPRVDTGLNKDPNYYFRTAPVRPASPRSGPIIANNGNTKADTRTGNLTIYTVENTAQTSTDDAMAEEKAVFLPAGSLISGVLLNGLDAATGRSARKDPFPVLVRIQKDAILPNQYTADVKECFATLSGYGELSSERAYLRGETFSCMTNDGEVIEIDQAFKSYAVGEDGKAGVRGRLVSKAGSLIAKTALAGFGAGVAEAFDSSPVPVLQTGSVGSNQIYQNNFSSDAARHGVSKGASAALTRIADYYMDMADQIYPVIEVDAGRQIDIVITNGFALKIKKATNALTTRG